MAWQVNGTPETLSGTSDSIVISDLTALIFNVLLTHQIASGNIGARIRFDNDSTTNYAFRASFDGATDTTAGNQNQAHIYSNVNTSDEFDFAYIINISAEEKLIIGFGMNAKTAGAGTPPARSVAVAKWANTSVAFTRIDQVNLENGDFASDSNESMLGTN